MKTRHYAIKFNGGIYTSCRCDVGNVLSVWKTRKLANKEADRVRGARLK